MAAADRENWLTPNPDLQTFQAIVSSMAEVIDVPEATITGLSVPTFGLVGSDDPERETIEQFKRLLPNFSFEVLPETDHPRSSKHPKLPQLIKEFLSNAEEQLTLTSSPC
ncbi:alpha/beta fold hydrolase [Pseudovibrio brasiliensis]|uniref:Alpha/beta hydrolase family protein n=1 Tax=Pseudovibrio brasiliensis TaxID=1898042 RepID=A0ABX8AUB5_9HYPH|nr:hypothetical protein [Pseudovibrio brasiliensis]QUS58228.1 hypothetical protein KGB56_06885 [Pseudovibrio brasiliensis]